MYFKFSRYQALVSYLHKIVNESAPFLDDRLDNQFVFPALITPFLYSLELEDLFVGTTTVGTGLLVRKGITIPGTMCSCFILAVRYLGIWPSRVQVYLRINNVS
jgi:hypothetical protein